MTALRTPRTDLIGIGWMLATGLIFVALNGVVHHIGSDLPASQQAFLRFLFGLPLVLPVLIPALRRGFAAPVWRLILLRGALHCAAVIAWFYAMASIPVAEVTAIGYLNPVLVTLGAALLLGERLSWQRIAAIGAALVGVLIVLRPGLREIGAGHAAQILASSLFALSYLVAKQLVERTSAAVAVAMMTLTVTIGLAPLAALVWVPPTPGQTGWLVLAAALGSAGHYCMARAFAAAPMVVTQPVTFLQLIWATILGAVAFGDRRDIWVLVGGAMMIGAITWITWRESRARRRPVARLQARPR